MRMSPRFAVFAAVAAAVGTAWGVSAHFNSASGTVDADGALVVTFKEAGLGDNTTADYTLTTSADATYQCFNNGSNVPQGNPYSLPSQSLSASGTFTSSKNGSITATLEVGPPNPAPADAVLKCVSTRKTLCLMAVSYTGTTLVDTTFNDSVAVTPDPAERSFSGPTKRNPTPANCVTSL